MKLPDLKYDGNGLIPAIIQDAENSEVLMMAYMNAASLEKTVSTGYTHFWSRGRAIPATAPVSIPLSTGGKWPGRHFRKRMSTAKNDTGRHSKSNPRKKRKSRR
jgi:hypothetical protein